MLFHNLDESDRFLYHYTTASAALGAILPSRQMRFNLASRMNDPRESKAWRFGMRGGDGANLVAINKEATDLIQRTSKLLCLTRDDPKRALGDEPEAVFGRGFGHSAMWAHYAGGYSGVCLVFDRERLRSQIEREFAGRPLYAGDVTYADYAHEEIHAFTLDGDRIEADGLEATVTDHFEEWHPTLFFRKNFDWADEFELRWLLREPDPAPEFVPIGDSLSAVVVGESFPSSERDSLKYLAERVGGPTLATCQWNNGYPDVLPWSDKPYINMRARFGGKPCTPPPSLRVKTQKRRRWWKLLASLTQSRRIKLL